MDEKTKERLFSQESFCFRALKYARVVAEQLVSNKPPSSFPFFEGGYSDDAIRDHARRFLKKWESDPHFVQKFRRFSLPLYNRFAEQIIRWTLDLPSDAKLQDFHIKQAAIAACLTPLRQSVGSCFATAPAIEIQEFHLDLFVDDLYELLSRGRLTRVVEGVEYAAPFCFTVSQKNSLYNALLKVWEFTLASYCDIKMEFSKWNLGWCIGIPPQEVGGIGAILKRGLEERLEKDHRVTQKRHQDVIVAHEQLKAVETLARSARTQEELRRLKAEGIAKAHHLHVSEELFNEAQEKEKLTAELLPLLLEQYTHLFQGYFQEIYDSEFTDEVNSEYEDRKAGFRLIYKHGRVDSSLWTPIYNSEQFIASLDDFFRLTESQLTHFLQTPHEKEVVVEMTTLILQHLHTKEFLETTLARAKKRGRLPWAYSSGGSVDQITSLYYRKNIPLQSEKRQIQNPLDLFTFIIETMKSLPPQQKPLLFESPTHVCLLLPEMSEFYEAWNDRGFTYTWIRDRWLEPAKQFYLEQKFSKEEQKELYRRLNVTGDLKASMTLQEFVHPLKYMDGLESFLYETLPLLPAERCQALLQTTPSEPFLSSEELFRRMYKQTADSLRAEMRRLKLAAPTFTFADTNWSNGYFSFVLNPVTLELEVWKTDRAGVLGAPIPLVKTWFGKEFWSIFHN